ncbi:MAG: hypothetical protein R6U51_10310, partial [Anaerolineales bacterium]
ETSMTRFFGSDQSYFKIPMDVVHPFRDTSKSGRHAPESVDSLFRIQWTTCSGFGGRFPPDYAKGIKGI